MNESQRSVHVRTCVMSLEIARQNDKLELIVPTWSRINKKREKRKLVTEREAWRKTKQTKTKDKRRRCRISQSGLLYLITKSSKRREGKCVRNN